MRDTLRAIWGRLFREGFVLNVLTVSSGAAVSIALNVFLTPIVTRLFGREDYGLAALFASVANMSVLVGTLMYPTAIVIPKEPSVAGHLVKVSLLLIGAMLSLAGLLYLSGIHKGLAFDWSAYESWVYLMPVAVIILTFDQATAALNVRDKAFRRNAVSNVLSGASNKLVTISAGLTLGTSQFGIIAGLLTGHLLAVLVRLNRGVSNMIGGRWDLREIQKTALHYISYPKYILPGDFINRFSRDSPLYFFAAYYSIDLVGSFAFAAAMLTIPYNIIGASVSPVFIQKAGELRDLGEGKLAAFTDKLNTMLFTLGVVPFALLVVFGGEIFAFVFSAGWREAGVYAGLLSIYFLFRLITSPMSSVFRVLEKERVTLVFNIFLFIGRIAVLFLASKLWGPFGAVLSFSVFSAGAYIVLMILIFRLVGLSWPPRLLKYVLFFFGMIGLLYGVKSFLYAI